MLNDIEILDHYLKSKPDFATVNCCWNRIKTELAESTNSSHNRSSVPCGDCGKLLPLNMECDNSECVRVIMRHSTH